MVSQVATKELIAKGQNAHYCGEFSKELCVAVEAKFKDLNREDTKCMDHIDASYGIHGELAWVCVCVCTARVLWGF